MGKAMFRAKKLFQWTLAAHHMIVKNFFQRSVLVKAIQLHPAAPVEAYEEAVQGDHNPRTQRPVSRRRHHAHSPEEEPSVDQTEDDTEGLLLFDNSITHTKLFLSRRASSQHSGPARDPNSLRRPG